MSEAERGLTDLFGVRGAGATDKLRHRMGYNAQNIDGNLGLCVSRLRPTLSLSASG